MKKIVVIGGGPAGYPAALQAASLGAQVTLVEKNKLGGVCLNCGCIPSKSFLDFAHKWALTREWGNTNNVNLDQLKTRQQNATQKLVQGIGFLLKKAGVTVLQGVGRLDGEHAVLVHLATGEEVRLEADGIILATGSEAFVPPPFDTLKDKIYDNSTFFTMPRLPKKIAIVGGGVIGCEMADCMCALGVEVHLIEMQPRLLPLEDENAARTLTQTFIKRGIVLHLGVSATDVRAENELFTLTLSDKTSLTCEAVLVAIGRKVLTDGLGLETIGVTATRKGVSVNPETLQLKNDVYAAGDLNGLCLLAHAASRQGQVAAGNVCGVPMVYHNERVPRAIYTTPEIASVGQTRAQLQESQIPFKTHKSFLLANGRAVAQGETTGYVEIYSHTQSGLILGANLVGAHATELIHIISVALAGNFTVSQLKEVIFAHPTLAESIGEALH